MKLINLLNLPDLINLQKSLILFLCVPSLPVIPFDYSVPHHIHPTILSKR